MVIGTTQNIVGSNLKSIHTNARQRTILRVPTILHINMAGLKLLPRILLAKPTGIEKNVSTKYVKRDIRIKKNSGKGLLVVIAMPPN